MFSKDHGSVSSESVRTDPSEGEKFRCFSKSCVVNALLAHCLVIFVLATCVFVLVVIDLGATNESDTLVYSRLLPARHRKLYESVNVAVAVICVCLCVNATVGALYVLRHDNSDHLTFYVTCMCMLLAAEVSAMVCLATKAFTTWDSFAVGYAMSMRNVIKDYAANAEVQESLDYVQRTLRCCGVAGDSDWPTGGGGGIPQSCCKAYNNRTSATALEQKCDTGKRSHIYTEGCTEKLIAHMEEWAVCYITVLAAMICQQILGISISCLLLNAFEGSRFRPPRIRRPSKKPKQDDVGQDEQTITISKTSY